MEEIFKVYKESYHVYRGYRKYEVSNLGRIKINGMIVEPHITVDGYCMIGKFSVHRAVAELFIPNPENKPCINHKDGNKLNNSLDNLEWATISENTKHAYANKLERNWWTKELGIICINLIENYKYNFADVAKLFGLPSRTYVFHFWNKGYKTFNLKHGNPFIPKHSNKLEIPDKYKEYILELIKDNTVLNN